MQGYSGLMYVTSKVGFDPSLTSAFGTLETNELHPVFQGDFVHGLNTQLWVPATTSGAGATVDTNLGRLRVQSGTAAAGYAYIIGRKIARYRAGQGTTARFTPLFTAGVADNIQLWGVGSIVSNAPYDGYFFGYNGTSFGVVHYRSGTPTWYLRSSDWNGYKADGTGGTFNWNPANGSPVMIKYPYLGYGDILFFVQLPLTGEWKLVHTIRYANTTSTTQLSNPNMQFIGFTLNSGNTTNMTMYCGSVGIFLSGEHSIMCNPKYAYDARKVTFTTETTIMNIKNCTTYNGVTNRGSVLITGISVGCSTNTDATIRIRIGATLGSAPTYTPINGSTADNGTTITNGNSITSVDTAGGLITNGTYISGVAFGQSGSQYAPLKDHDLYINPGEIMSISGFANTNTTATVCVTMAEDI